jgi:hypothetical protein
MNNIIWFWITSHPSELLPSYLLINNDIISSTQVCGGPMRNFQAMILGVKLSMVGIHSGREAERGCYFQSIVHLVRDSSRRRFGVGTMISQERQLCLMLCKRSSDIATLRMARPDKRPVFVQLIRQIPSRGFDRISNISGSS